MAAAYLRNVRCMQGAGALELLRSSCCSSTSSMPLRLSLLGVAAAAQRAPPSSSPSTSAQAAAPRELYRTTAVACRAASASGGAAAPSPDLVTRIKEDMKAAMKARDSQRLEAIRFLSAAIKQREIELREGGQAVGDAEVLGVINKLVKQRRDAIEQYSAGGRADLADKEAAELGVLQSYLPKQLSRDEVAAIVDAAVAEAGATSLKQMGAVMKLVTAKAAGAADNKTVSELVKAALGGAKK